MNTDNRTDDELNRIIAEWIGFTLWESKRGEYTLQYAWKPGENPISRVRFDTRDEYKKTNWQVEWSKYDSKRFGGQLPNYCRDLNVVHEAESSIYDAPCTLENDRKRKLHRQALEAACGRYAAFYRSSARQRAEALVRVIEVPKR